MVINDPRCKLGLIVVKSLTIVLYVGSYRCSHWDLSNVDDIYKKIKVYTTKKGGGAMYHMDTWT